MESKAVRTIAAAGVTAGAMDITAAMLAYDAKPLRILQSISSGLLGRAAYEGGIPTGVLGLLLQFVIATGAAAVFYLAARVLPVLGRRAVPCGLAYGVLVYFVMRYGVLPLSRVTLGPFSWELLIKGVLIHAFCVGLPIALVTRRLSRPAAVTVLEAA
ncbi:MAG: hypothetical protein R2991_00705 [Thermoanaerobaculia bacterium]